MYFYCNTFTVSWLTIVPLFLNNFFVMCAYYTISGLRSNIIFERTWVLSFRRPYTVSKLQCKKSSSINISHDYRIVIINMIDHRNNAITALSEMLQRQLQIWQWFHYSYVTLSGMSITSKQYSSRHSGRILHVHFIYPGYSPYG